jgi:hypothetical protein
MVTVAGIDGRFHTMSVATYVNVSVPLKPAAGVYVKPPSVWRVTVPCVGFDAEPADRR